MARLAVALLSLLLLLVVPAGARAATTTLAPVTDDSPMSAAGGWVAWSERDAAGVWRLVTWHAGTKAVVPVPGRSVPFDLDLGRDAAGRVVATYSRCAREPETATDARGYVVPDVDTWLAARGCSVRQLDLASGREAVLDLDRPAGAVDVTPSRSGRFVAWARRTGRSPVFRVLLRDERTGRTTELPHGRVPPPEGGVVGTGQVESLDLGPRAVGFVWRVDGAPFGIGPVWEARLVTLRDRTRIVGGSGYISGACGSRVPTSPSVEGTSLWFAEDRDSCDSRVSRAVRVRADGLGAAVSEPGVLVRRLSRAGGSLYELREPAPPLIDGIDGTEPTTCHDPVRPCSLVRLTPPPALPEARKRMRSPIEG